MQEKHKENNKNQTDLKTTLRKLERHTKGIMGLADFEYILPIKRSDSTEYDIASTMYHFYINSEDGLLIIGGDQKHRDQVKNILSRFFNRNTDDISEIYFIRDSCYALVNKIKKDGPKLDLEYRNILKFCEYYTGKKKTNKGAKEQSITMEDDDDDPRCVSKHPTFQNAYNNCESLDVKLRTYRCNSIWTPRNIEERILYIKTTAEFIFNQNTDFENWVIFIMDTCKKYLLDSFD